MSSTMVWRMKLAYRRAMQALQQTKSKAKNLLIYGIGGALVIGYMTNWKDVFEHVPLLTLKNKLKTAREKVKDVGATVVQSTATAVKEASSNDAAKEIAGTIAAEATNTKTTDIKQETKALDKDAKNVLKQGIDLSKDRR